MGNTTSTKKVNFEDIQYLIKKKRNFLLINTLSPNQQDCLIKKTIPDNGVRKKKSLQLQVIVSLQN